MERCTYYVKTYLWCASSSLWLQFPIVRDCQACTKGIVVVLPHTRSYAYARRPLISRAGHSIYRESALARVGQQRTTLIAVTLVSLFCRGAIACTPVHSGAQQVRLHPRPEDQGTHRSLAVLQQSPQVVCFGKGWWWWCWVPVRQGYLLLARHGTDRFRWEEGTFPATMRCFNTFTAPSVPLMADVAV